jgi:hypothetical protein
VQRPKSALDQIRSHLSWLLSGRQKSCLSEWSRTLPVLCVAASRCQRDRVRTAPAWILSTRQVCASHSISIISWYAS